MRNVLLSGLASIFPDFSCVLQFQPAGKNRQLCRSHVAAATLLSLLTSADHGAGSRTLWTSAHSTPRDHEHGGERHSCDNRHRGSPRQQQRACQEARAEKELPSHGSRPIPHPSASVESTQEIELANLFAVGLVTGSDIQTARRIGSDSVWGGRSKGPAEHRQIVTSCQTAPHRPRHGDRRRNRRQHEIWLPKCKSGRLDVSEPNV